jgi:Transposase, Mutator family
MGQALSGGRPGVAPGLGIVVPFFAFAPGIRKMIYTTNAVEAPHRSLRKIVKMRGSFPNDDAAISRSRMPACAGGEASNGRRPWVSSPFSSASDSQERRDDQDNRHHGTVDDRLVRTFAVKPSAFGAPLRGFRA